MPQDVPHCSSARRWGSVCRSGCFWDVYLLEQALVLGSRRSHIHLFLTDFVLILFLPTIGLCRLKLGGGEAAFLAVFHTEIFFLGLVLPLTPFIQRAHRQQNVGMRIVAVGIMDGSIGAHPV